MKNSRAKKLLALLFGSVLWAGLSGVWYVVWTTFYNATSLRPLQWKGNLLVAAIYGLILFVFTFFYGGYRVGSAKRGDVFFSGVLSLLLTNGITYLQSCLMAAMTTPLNVATRLLSPLPMLLMTLAQAVVIWLWAHGVSALFLRLFPPSKMLVVYGKKESTRALIYKMIEHSEKYQICEAVHASDLEQVLRRVEFYETVLLCDVDAALRSDILKFCFSRGLPVYLAPHIADTIVRGAESVHLFDTPMLLCQNQGLNTEQRFLKRSLDLAASSLGLVLASPFMLLTALAIRLCDGGPALFRQQRLTRDGKIFEIVKFRSMVIDAEGDGVARLAAEGDDRVTPVGRVIRRLRLDELPQLFNVLKGEMSLVGPRPERPELAEEYRRAMPEFDFRLKVKAGVTGYAQVLGKYNTTPYDKLKLDMMYITQYSLLLDCKLLLMTVKTLFQRESTEGVALPDEQAAPPTVTTKR